MSSQIAMPVPLHPDEVTRESTLGGAAELSAYTGLTELAIADRLSPAISGDLYLSPLSAWPMMRAPWWGA